eukprot:104432-Chlamydomonas_euryale.AAC.2
MRCRRNGERGEGVKGQRGKGRRGQEEWGTEGEKEKRGRGGKGGQEYDRCWGANLNTFHGTQRTKRATRRRGQGEKGEREEGEKGGGHAPHKSTAAFAREPSIHACQQACGRTQQPRIGMPTNASTNLIDPSNPRCLADADNGPAPC